MKTISILNYGCGNLLSIKRAIEEVGYNSKIISEKEEIEKANFIILPGVGAFENAMNLLKQKNYIEPLKQYVLKEKKPILGICLGMQLFLTKSFEMGEHDGLDFISGEVISLNKLSKNKEIKVPQINWNKIKFAKESKTINIQKNLLNKSFYFIHSYMAKLTDQKNLLGYCNYYDLSIPAVIQSENILGCQFHPEKSGKNGLTIFKNILSELK
jgi:glutamine amidotransferase